MSGWRVAAVLLWCVVAVAGTAGCARTVSGAATGSGPSTQSALATAPLPALLVDAAAFPADYEGTPADGKAALATVDGAPDGATVSPAECAPEKPGDAAALRGDRDTTALVVVLARGVKALSDWRDQMGRCPSYSVTDSDGASWDVDTQMLAPPVVDVDDAFAFDRTQTGGPQLHSVTLVGQIGAVRVMVQVSGPAGGELDTAALDAAFSAQVRKLRRSA